MVRHGTAWGLSGSLSDVWINPLPQLHRPGDEMRTIVRVLVATALVFSGSGCAKTDWIDRTLVTVDVTGTWYGGVRGGWAISDLSFELEQQGATVKGSVQWTPGTRGDIEGTLAGDVFRFRNARGSVEGEMTVSGDEMSGRITTSGFGARPFSLRRVDPSSLPASPPR
jgi:hypothetical protein